MASVRLAGFGLLRNVRVRLGKAVMARLVSEGFGRVWIGWFGELC